MLTDDERQKLVNILVPIVQCDHCHTCRLLGHVDKAKRVVDLIDMLELVPLLHGPPARPGHHEACEPEATP